MALQWWSSQISRKWSPLTKFISNKALPMISHHVDNCVILNSRNCHTLQWVHGGDLLYENHSPLLYRAPQINIVSTTFFALYQTRNMHRIYWLIWWIYAKFTRNLICCLIVCHARVSSKIVLYRKCKTSFLPVPASWKWSTRNLQMCSNIFVIHMIHDLFLSFNRRIMHENFPFSHKTTH